MSAPNELPELWNIDHLAEYLGVSKQSVYKLTAAHRIRFLRVGKELRFRPADVAAYLEAQVVEIRPRRGRPRSRDRVAS